MSEERIRWTGRIQPRPPRNSTPGEVFTWTDMKRNEWQISFDVADRQGRRQAVGFRIVAAPTTDVAIDTEVMRALPFATLLNEYLKHSTEDTLAPKPSEKQKGAKRGTPLDDRVLALVADLYRHAINTGLSPSAYIGKEMNISPSAAAKRIQAARKAAFLKPARRGKPGEREET